MPRATARRTMQASGDEIDVLPPERDQLAQPKARFEADQDHRPPRLVRTGDQPLGLLEVEEVELRVRDLQPLDRRKVIELFPLDCEREEAAKDREVVVHRLR